MNNEHIKCRFCSWKTKRLYKNKKGTLIIGIERLERHVWLNHTDEYNDIKDKTDVRGKCAACHGVGSTTAVKGMPLTCVACGGSGRIEDRDV